MVTDLEVKRVYKAKAGGPISDSEAVIIGQEFERIRRTTGAGITADDIVDAARPPRAPLHDFFEWNERIAAQAHRLEQARKLARSIEVVVITPTRPDGVRVRGWHSVIVDTADDSDDSDDSDERQKGTRARKQYMPVEVVAEVPDFTAQVIARAANEARGWAARYQRYQELAEFSPLLPVVDAINALPL